MKFPWQKEPWDCYKKGHKYEIVRRWGKYRTLYKCSECGEELMGDIEPMVIGYDVNNNRVFTMDREEWDKVDKNGL